MTQPARLFYDVTFTRTQLGSVGITRTVRRLATELSSIRVAEGASPCEEVAYHSAGYRRIDDQRKGGRDDVTKSWLARLLRHLMVGSVWRRVVILFPIWAQYLLWKFHSRGTFDGLSRGLAPVQFRPGDWLFVFDAAWTYRAWRGAAKARAQGAKVVFMVYDLIPLENPEYCAPLFSASFESWLRAMPAASDGILCISQASQDQLVAYAAAQAIKLPPSRPFRLGCDPQTGAVSGVVRDDIRAWMAAADPVYVCVGSVEPRKNHEWLLGVFQSLWAEGFAGRLLIVGRVNPDCADFVERLRQHEEQGKKLLSIHDANDAEVDESYRRARALVFPSLAEGFGLPLVEARVRSCPVIASELPALREIADDGCDFFPRGDAAALKQLLISHALRDRRSIAPPMMAFTWADSARACVERVSAMLSPSPPSGTPSR